MAEDGKPKGNYIRGESKTRKLGKRITASNERNGQKHRDLKRRIENLERKVAELMEWPYGSNKKQRPERGPDES